LVWKAATCRHGRQDGRLAGPKASRSGRHGRRGGIWPPLGGGMRSALSELRGRHTWDSAGSFGRGVGMENVREVRATHGQRFSLILRACKEGAREPVRLVSAKLAERRRKHGFRAFRRRPKGYGGHSEVAPRMREPHDSEPGLRPGFAAAGKSLWGACRRKRRSSRS